MADEKLKIQIETEAGQAKEQISGIKKEVQEFGKVSDSASDDLKGLADKIEDVGAKGEDAASAFGSFKAAADAAAATLRTVDEAGLETKAALDVGRGAVSGAEAAFKDLILSGKATTEELQQADSMVKKLGGDFEQLAAKAKPTWAEQLRANLTKLSTGGVETAGKILAIVGALEQFGDQSEKASKEAEDFGKKSKLASQTAALAIGTIMPSLGPLAAVAGVVGEMIGKMIIRSGELAEKEAKLAHNIDVLHYSMEDHVKELQKIIDKRKESAHSAEEAQRIESEALKMEEQQLRAVAHDYAYMVEDRIKARERLAEVERRLNDERIKQEDEAARKFQATTQKYVDSNIEFIDKEAAAKKAAATSSIELDRIEVKSLDEKLEAALMGVEAAKEGTDEKIAAEKRYSDLLQMSRIAEIQLLKAQQEEVEKLKKAHEDLTDEVAQSLGDLNNEIFSTLTEQQNKEFELDAETSAKKLEAEEESYQNHLEYIELTAASNEDLAKRTDEYLQGLLESEQTSVKLREQILLQFAAKRRQANAEMLADEKASQKKTIEAAQQTANAELKIEQDKEKKLADALAQGLGILFGKSKDWGNQMLGLAKKLATDQLSVLQSQVVAELQEYQSLSSKYGQTEATMMLQSKSSMAAKLASAFAPLGPFAVPATAAAIAAMSAVVNAVGGAFKFESGKTSSGRPVGLGNADPDAPNAHVGPDETVLTGAQTRALGGSEAILAAAAGQAQQGGGAPGRMDVFVHHTFEGIPSGMDSFLRPWMPALLKAIDEQVLRYRSKLTATHFLSARNPA